VLNLDESIGAFKDKWNCKEFPLNKLIFDREEFIKKGNCN